MAAAADGRRARWRCRTDGSSTRRSWRAPAGRWRSRTPPLHPAEPGLTGPSGHVGPGGFRRTRVTSRSALRGRTPRPRRGVRRPPAPRPRPRWTLASSAPSPSVRRRRVPCPRRSRRHVGDLPSSAPGRSSGGLRLDDLLAAGPHPRRDHDVRRPPATKTRIAVQSLSRMPSTWWASSTRMYSIQKRPDGVRGDVQREGPAVAELEAAVGPDHQQRDADAPQRLVQEGRVVRARPVAAGARGRSPAPRAGRSARRTAPG